MTYEIKADALDTAFDTVTLAPHDLAADVASLQADVARLNARPLARPALSGAKAEDGGRSVFVERYLRKGLEAAPEVKSLNATNATDGGVAVPREIDALIDITLKAVSPIRRIANVVSIGSVNYRKLIAVGGVASGWVAETAGRPETGVETFIEIAPPMGELYANPAASQTMLDDAMFDVERWLAGEIGNEFARAESVAFVTGSGVARPKGFITYPVAVTDDTTRAFGTLQYIASGAAGAFAASNPQDKLIDLVHALRAPYRPGASWVMNSSTLAKIRKLKDSTGAFIWQPALAADQPATLLGYPVFEAEAMPDVAADSLSIAFGNFQAGYLIAERAETSVLRDPYTNKPFVQFYATRRVGGAVVNSEAIKLMKFAVS
ncbi:phage major capsid protein [Glacieibacterium sp.]|uniref:phage major capsid protein n=1 Tax=Glacieibacterium sp. TaxID=2860237 RepID=UPI003AFF6F63